MMQCFPTNRFPPISTIMVANAATCSSVTHSAVDIDPIEESAVNDSVDDDAITHKKIDIYEATFPHKLHYIIQNPDFKDIISWMPSGRSWKMIDREEFTKRVLPLFFRHQKFASFKRQLSGWEFVRGVKESSTDEYHHPVSKLRRIQLST